MCVALVGIVAQVVYLQTRESDTLRSAGANQWTRNAKLPAQRGTVFDRHGNELAMSVEAASISINPKLLEDGEATVLQLANMIELSDEKVASLMSEVESKNKGFVYVARQVDASIGDAIRWLGIEGVNIDSEDRRELPGGDTAKSVIGKTNIDGTGIAGLEVQYDDLLTGTEGAVRREVDSQKRTVAGSETVIAEPVNGDDLVLTIDRSIQFGVEQALIDQVNTIGAKGASAVVMDTDSGEILGLASVRRDTESGLAEVTAGNFAAVDAYEPGSVAKVITVAAALNEGVVTPETQFNVPWRKQYYDDLLKDSHQHPDEYLSVEQILVASSNIGTITVSEQIGLEKQRQYMSDFGLGEITALDFPSESSGILKEVGDLWGSERVTISYGQGVSSTSLQLVSAVNTIANGGVYVDPKLVIATVGPEGEQTLLPESATRRVVSETAARQTADMMLGVVCRGTAKRAQVENWQVAGKTGTAFKATDNGTYWTDAGQRIYYASFVGFFPADDPQVTVLVSVDEPPAETNFRFGGTAAAPVFADLVPTLVHELNLQPNADTSACPE